MIDNYQEVMELVEKIKEHLPIDAYAGKGLVYTLAQQGIKIKKKQRIKIEHVHYLGDEGGISCHITGLESAFKEKKQATITSITHIRIPDRHPLAGDIRAYQVRRLRKITGMGGTGPSYFTINPKKK